MQSPEISVVVPVYNVDKYLTETLTSIQNQTFRNFEVICVDDGSTDRSLSMLKAFAKKDNRFFVMQQNRMGAGTARNYGFTAVRGKYTIFLDSDDLFEPTLLEKLWEAAQREQADIAACNFCCFDEKGNTIKRYGVYTNLDWLPKGIRVFNYQDCPNRIMSVVNPTPWNKLYRSDFIREHNLRYEEISSTNDITFAAVSVATAQRITYITDYLVKYRVSREGSITSRKSKSLNNVHIAVSSAIRQARMLPYSDVIEDSIAYFAVENYLFALKHYIADFDDPISEEYYTNTHNTFNGPDFINVSPESLKTPNLSWDYMIVKRNDYQTMRSAIRKK